MEIKTAKDLIVYQKAYAQAMRIFEITKRFPIEERFALTDQIRRSSRSVCQNLREAWAKRRYPAHFVSKLTDCDGENDETATCLDFCNDCKYVTPEEYTELAEQNIEVRKMLNSLLFSPEKFLIKHNKNG